jgi:hypothetical protein
MRVQLVEVVEALLAKTAGDYDGVNQRGRRRRGGRVADRTGLENRRRRKTTEGSNPSPSASLVRTCGYFGRESFGVWKGACYTNCYVKEPIASCSTSSTLA